jgi:hypothetical protein
MKNKFVKLIAGVMPIALALASGCGKAGSPGSASGGDTSDESPGSLESRVDHHGDEIMASSTKAEARAWMKQPKHVFFKADPKQVGQFVEEFYGAGATQVLIADIEEQEGAQYGEGLLVVLPKDKDARTKLFEISGRAEALYEEDPVTDKGQKYLYYSLD